MRTEAEQRRLILTHTHLVPMVASVFRGSKGIPFDALEAAAMRGLWEAARDWQAKGEFPDFAYSVIRNHIRWYVRDWDAAIGAEAEDERLDFAYQIIKPDLGPAGSYEVGRVYEWDSWGHRDYINAISENWDWPDLASTPEELGLEWEKVRSAGAAIQ